MQKDLIRLTLSIERTALAPIIAAGVGKHVALSIEGCAGDGPIDRRETLESLLVVLIPEVDDTIAADGGERSKGVEGDLIDAENVGILTMALEGEGILAGNLLQVVDADPSLDAANGEAGHVGEGRDASRLELERTFLPAVLGGLALNVVRYDMPAGRGHDH
eukprot:CAMPEP_0178694990 /NCGR_PEP_ID=MMETSP0699-20121125/8587_1 /TAXON_ID=265572 /ORGANISM="Extubocellulus spinifer, Strain CCMP396" /LENGTH=161 /DNA_ID=CAMNT_0020340599 /DNA_START=1999 /DNA_END=2484 /DNA_ORIENTATION=-